VNAGDATEVDRTAEMATIDATPATIDQDTTAATDTTTSQNAETATVEATAGGDVKATTVEWRQKRGRGKKTSDDKN
jgi:hypothetical protein